MDYIVNALENRVDCFSLEPVHTSRIFRFLRRFGQVQEKKRRQSRDWQTFSTRKLAKSTEKMGMITLCEQALDRAEMEALVHLLR